MNALDLKIREALGADGAGPLGPLDEPSLWRQVAEIFRGRGRWIAVVMLAAIVAFAVLGVVSAVCFFRAEGVREMIAWAGGFGLSLIAVTAARLWFWMELNQNTVLREIKRVRLQIALLAGRLKKSE